MVEDIEVNPEKQEVSEEEEPPKILPLTDKNIISPGTTFSALLSKHLQYFIRFKLNTDPVY